MNKERKKRKDQLGLDPGTASSQLRKMLLFSLVQETNKDICYQCNQRIDDIKELSVEHKTPWLHAENAKELFFDLKNIAYSHLKCNTKAARQPLKGTGRHPSAEAYRKGCRCLECKEVVRLRIASQRAKRKTLTGKDR